MNTEIYCIACVNCSNMTVQYSVQIPFNTDAKGILYSSKLICSQEVITSLCAIKVGSHYAALLLATCGQTFDVEHVA